MRIILLTTTNILNIKSPSSEYDISHLSNIADTLRSSFKEFYPFIFDSSLSEKDKLKSMLDKSFKNNPAFDSLGKSGVDVSGLLSNLAGLSSSFGGGAMATPKIKLKFWNSPAESHRDISKLLKLHLSDLEDKFGEKFESSENLLLSPKVTSMNKDENSVFFGNEESMLAVLNRIYNFVALLSTPENNLIQDHVIICDNTIANLIRHVVTNSRYEEFDLMARGLLTVSVIENKIDKGKIYG